MLNSDINSIHNLCLSNKTSFNVCDSNYFWENKFYNDNLPIIENKKTPSQWINEYKKIDSISNEVEQLLRILKILNIKSITIPITVRTNNPKAIIMLNTVFTQQISEINNFFYINDYMDNQIYLYKIQINDNNITIGAVNLLGNYQISIPVAEDVRTIIIKMIYYYPALRITEYYNSAVSLRKKDLEDVINNNKLGGILLINAKNFLAQYK